MGLDLVVAGCAKPGHEAEWRWLLERSFADETLSDEEITRFNAISIPGYQRIGAPQVGKDPAANAWIIDARQAKTPDEIAQILREFEGYYVLGLLSCPGVPTYSNGGLYDEVDGTSFRGAFLQGCRNVINDDLLGAAWEDKFPDAAIVYGRALLAAADVAEKSQLKPRQGLLQRLGFGKPAETAPLAEQLDIVRSAGHWHVFWGERGHPIRAYF